MQNGLFDLRLVGEHVKELDRRRKANNAQGSFTGAWELYHCSFADNQEQVLDTIYQSFKSNINYLSAIDLNSTVWLFKNLGRTSLGEEMIRFFIDNRGENPKVFDLNSYPFKQKIDDPDLITAFAEKLVTFKDDDWNPAAAMEYMAETHSWRAEDLERLAVLPEDHYVAIFKKFEGPKLRGILDSCLQFDRIGNPSSEMVEISTRTKCALRRLGRESAINRLRVKRYGIEVEASDQ